MLAGTVSVHLFFVYVRASGILKSVHLIATGEHCQTTGGVRISADDEACR